jgi:ATP-dependent Clp protease protease subunit
MLHQPLGGIGGQATDIDIAAKEIVFIKQQINEILALHTGKTPDTIRADTDRDFFLRPQEALDYGIIDQIVSRKE